MHRNTLARHRSRFAREGNEGGGGGNAGQQTGQNDGQSGGAQGGQQAADQGGQSTGGGQNDGQQQSSDGLLDDSQMDERTRKVIDAVRGDYKAERAKRQAAEQAAQTAAEEARNALVRDLGKALGLVKDEDQAPDPAKLTEQLTGTQTENRSLKAEIAVLRSAGKHGADPEALTDSRSFLAKLDTLDPAADDFAAQVDAAIKQAVADNPKLKAGRVPGASGADHPGGSGEAPRKPSSLAEAIAGHYGTA